MSTVWISLSVEGSTAVVAVSDDGSGIPEDQRHRVLDRFSRIDVDRRRDTSGAGLGLAIAHEIALAHGGAVAVVDSRHGGATVELVLPLLHFQGPLASGTFADQQRDDDDDTDPRGHAGDDHTAISR